MAKLYNTRRRREVPGVKIAKVFRIRNGILQASRAQGSYYAGSIMSAMKGFICPLRHTGKNLVQGHPAYGNSRLTPLPEK